MSPAVPGAAPESSRILRSDVVVPNDEQRAAIDHRGGVLRVLGAPRTGKTETAVAIVLDRIRRGEVTTDEVLLLASTRHAAARLRRRVMIELGGTATTPLARTTSSLAFGILRQQAALVGDPPPRLLNGPEQDIVIRDLLAGHASGAVPEPPWPESVRGALPTRAFRAEIRDLLMRAVENSLGAADLLDLADRFDVPEWRAGAHFLEEYDRVTALATPGAFDPAWIVAAAESALLDDAALAAAVRADLRLVVVDDAQELTPGAARLLATIAAIPTPHPLDVVLIGDPDSTVQTFRGADPGILGGAADPPVAWTTLSRTGATETIRLRTAYRPERLLQVSARISGAIGTVGGTDHRDVTADAGAGEGTVETHLLRTPSAEAAYVASRVRAAVLHEDRRWSDIAVIVRGRRRSDAIRRALALADVPVAADTAELPVRDEPAVRPLLHLLGAVLAGGDGDPAGGLTTDVVVDLLGSRIGGTDAVALRRLRRRLRQVELRAGGRRTSDELLVEAVRHPLHLEDIGAEATGARRIADAYAAGLAACSTLDEAGTRTRRPGVLVEDILWAMWSALRLAKRWRETALAGGAAGARADRDLDAVLALFDAATRFTDRLTHADPDSFLTHIDEQEVPGDTLALRSPVGDAVSVLTPAGAAGQAWPLVIVPGVQDGVWPDTRLRGLLLRSSELVDCLRGRPRSWRSAAVAVRHDETRLFHVAVSRATEHLIVTAVRDETDQPSAYVEIVDGSGGLGERPLTEVTDPTTSRELVAWLRRTLAETPPDAAPDPALPAALAHLAASGVTGADPDQWWSRRHTTSRRPLLPPDGVVDISPSRIQAFEDCPLQWLLTSRGGNGPSVGAADLGTLIHDIARDLGDAPVEDLIAEVDARWPRLGLPDGWPAERARALAHEMMTRLGAYIEHVTAQGWTKVGAEVEMRVPLGRATLRGQVDRIEQDVDGRIRIIDYKTGSTKPATKELPRHAQLGAYQVALVEGAFTDHLGHPAESAPVSAGAGLLQLGKAAGKSITLSPQPPLHEDDDPQWAHTLIAETADGMAAATFLARPDEQRCKRCPVRRTCPAQPEGTALA
ncbi:MAG TPA: ATP-dependent helicase [Intrasporangiaceae bacterium]|nr:ATP-dependent helicase [Intrasporangiaceae bacterium]